MRLLPAKRSSAKPAEVGCSDFWRQLESNPDFAHGYDTLMTSLSVLGTRRPLVCVMLTSARPEEGKTTVSFGLALAMTRAGKNVLLADTDFRRPRIHRLLRLENSLGLAEVLGGSAGILDVIRAVRVGDNDQQNPQTLSVVTSGIASNASYQALGSPKMKEAIEDIAKRYDVVLFDSPPTLAVSDPLLLAPLVDGVILVLSTGTITHWEVERTKKRLEESGGRLVGVVLNRFDQHTHGPGVHPYHSYYFSREAE